jgi:hypothetical protein
MTLISIPKVKHLPGTTWRKTQKLGTKLSQTYVCAGFFAPGKWRTSKPGEEPNKYMGLRRVIFSYVLTDGAWPYSHATDPSLKGTLHAN